MAIIPGTLCGTVTGFAFSTLAIISSPGKIRNEGTRKNCISAEISENGRESYTLYENEEGDKIGDLSYFSGVLSYDGKLETAIINAWIYTYRRTFEVAEKTLHNTKNVLVCEELDTLADVYLNGTHLGSCENMHRTYRFDVTELLRAGINEIVVELHSPLKYMEEQYEKRPLWGVSSTVPGYQHIRKAHCMFGWDWGPKLLDLGVWGGGHYPDTYFYDLCDELGLVVWEDRRDYGNQKSTRS